MGDAVADAEEPNRNGAGMVDVSPHTTTPDLSSELGAVGSDPAGLAPPTDEGSGLVASADRDGRTSGSSPPFSVDDLPSTVVETGPAHGDTLANGATPSDPLVLESLLLLDTEGNEPIDIDVLTFSDDGIGVTRTRADGTRILPWSSVVAHVVEAWTGGIVPEWWVDPELNRNNLQIGEMGSITDPGATTRSLPHVEAGALIGIQTSSGTYRFLIPGGDAQSLSRTINGLAVEHHGQAGASSVTRVVAWGQDIERRKTKRKPEKGISWSKVQPYLVVLLVMFIAAAVTLILLQSAGTVHLPYLGGNGSGSLGPLRTP